MTWVQKKKIIKLLGLQKLVIITEAKKLTVIIFYQVVSLVALYFLYKKDRVLEKINKLSENQHFISEKFHSKMVGSFHQIIISHKYRN